MRVLIVSHAHPKRVAGGAQLAAHQLHRELLRLDGVESHFLAYAAPGKVRLATFSSQSRDGLEILFHGGPLNPLLFSQENTWFVTHDFRELLDRLEPDVVHFQHYVAVGVDLMREVRNWSARVPMVLTLHDFFAMCHAGGRMVKEGRAQELCYGANPHSCAECFPSLTPEDFFLRELFIKSHLELVDQFIAPSAFLKKRYVEWGVPAEQIEVVENGQPYAPVGVLKHRAPSAVHFAFFGKVFKSKGALIFLEAIELLSPALREKCEFSIYGAGIEEESPQVRSEFSSRLSRLGKAVRTYGSYDPEEVNGLMSRVDFAVVPSTWWENSPMVIQEAFASGVPVICSNIGGMAEKVTDGVNGLHFRVNDPRDLAATIETAVTTAGLRQRLAEGIKKPPSVRETAEWHLSAYQKLIVQRATARPPASPSGFLQASSDV
jgi:glycosyltransferase involved in cell wall biosynthesis